MGITFNYSQPDFNNNMILYVCVCVLEDAKPIFDFEVEKLFSELNWYWFFCWSNSIEFVVLGLWKCMQIQKKTLCNKILWPPETKDITFRSYAPNFHFHFVENWWHHSGFRRPQLPQNTYQIPKQKLINFKNSIVLYKW